jgi:hypothetical protein
VGEAFDTQFEGDFERVDDSGFELGIGKNEFESVK